MQFLLWRINAASSSDSAALDNTIRGRTSWLCSSFFIYVYAKFYRRTFFLLLKTLRCPCNLIGLNISIFARYFSYILVDVIMKFFMTSKLKKFHVAKWKFLYQHENNEIFQRILKIIKKTISKFSANVEKRHIFLITLEKFNKRKNFIRTAKSDSRTNDHALLLVEIVLQPAIALHISNRVILLNGTCESSKPRVVDPSDRMYARNLSNYVSGFGVWKTRRFRIWIRLDAGLFEISTSEMNGPYLNLGFIKYHLFMLEKLLWEMFIFLYYKWNISKFWYDAKLIFST